MSHSKSVNQLLNESTTGLTQVLQRATQLRRLSAELRNLLDKPLNEHIYVANVRDNTVVIGTDSSIWHSRVKYLGPMILEHLQSLKGWSLLQNIEFRVQPHMLQLLNSTSSRSESTTKQPEDKLSNQADHKFNAQIRKARQNLS